MKNNKANSEKEIQELTEENENLRQQLSEANDIIVAIQNGEVDALVMNTEKGKQIFTLEGADHSYRVLVETMNESAVTIDSDLTILFSNRRFSEMVSFAGNKLLGRSIRQFIYKDDLPALLSSLSKSSSEQKNIELRMVDGAGVIIPVLFSSNPLTDDSGGHWLIFTELTELKKAQYELTKINENLENSVRQRTKELQQTLEELQASTEELNGINAALKESENKFRSVLDNTTDVIYRFNIQTGKYEYMSPSCKITIGFDAEEMVAMSSEEVIARVHPDDRPGLMYTIAAANETGKALCEYRFMHSDGNYHWWSNQMVVTRDEEGQLLYRDSMVRDISNSKLAEEKLRDSEQELQLIIDTVPALIVHLDTTFHYRRVNEGYRLWFGIDPQNMIGKHIRDILGDVTWETVKKRLEQVMGGETVTYEEFMPYSIGKQRWVSTTIVPYFDDNGVVKGCVGHVTDIAERKKAEDKLRESESRYHQMFERHHAVKLLIDPETGAIIDANTATLKYYGYTLEQLCSLCIQDINQLNPDEVEEEYNKALAEQRNYFVFQHRLANGEVRWVEVFSSPVQTKGRQLLYSIIHDITARKKAEEAIAASESEFRLLTESMPQIVWTTTADGLNTYFNQKWVEYTGMTLEESYGTGWNKPFHPDDQRLAWDAWQNAVLHNAPYLLQCRLRRADGVYRWWLIHGVPVNDKNGTITKWYGTCTDIDDMRKADNELKEKNIELAEINATKDKFFKIIAHDMKNPYISLLGASELLMDNAHKYDAEKLNRLTTVIHESAKSGYDMLLNLLDWARSQAGNISITPEKINLKGLITRNLSGLVDFAGRKNIDLRFDIENDLNIVADRNMLETILRNLISNAVKFTKRGGLVTISISNDNGSSIITVKDTGVGIEECNFRKLFRNDIKFSKPGTEFESGTGLGLMLCKDFVEKHGGKIWVESEVDKGSTFYFTLGESEN